jgi:hypothetical protein
MSGRASVIGKKGAVRDLAWGPDGLADVVPTDQGRFPPSAESLSTRDDRFGQPEAGKLFHIFNKRPADEGYSGCSVPRRPGPAPEPNAALRVGVMGEAGDFKCLTSVKLKPRPVRKPGLFFRPPALRPGLAGDRSPLRALAGFPRRRHHSSQHHPSQRPTRFA